MPKIFHRPFAAPTLLAAANPALVGFAKDATAAKGFPLARAPFAGKIL